MTHNFKMMKFYLRTPIIIHAKKMKSRCNNVYEFTLNARETWCVIPVSIS